ncbi:MAG: CBS domain-containing protein [Candidatus Desulfacyla sp.]
MAEEKRVKDIMVPIEEYDKVNVDSQFCDVLSILRRNYENMKTGQNNRRLHRTLFVTDADNTIVGKISMYDLIRGLVPEPAKAPEVSKAYHRMLSSRAVRVSEEVGEVQEHYKWLQTSFEDLVKREAHKKIRDIMKPVQKSVLVEDDRINQAIYVIFKEDVRQQLVHREGKIVGVVNLNALFAELLEVVGPECQLFV